MKITIQLSLAVLLTTSLANAQQRDIPRAQVAQEAPLKVNPANDQFIRINNMYKAAVNTTDRRTSETWYGHCIPLIQDYLSDFPTDKNAEPARYYLGESYYKVGEVHKAMTTFHNLIKRHKKGVYVAASAYRIARNFYSESKFVEAAKYFGITADNTEDAADRIRATYFRAQCLTRAGKLQEAAPYYQIVATTEAGNPYKAAATLTSARLLLQAGKFQEAVEMCEKILADNPDNDTKAEFAYYAGVAVSNLDDQAKSMEYFQMSMDTDSPKLKGRAQTGIMAIHFASKDHDAVIKEARRGKYDMSDKYKANQGFMVGSSYFKKTDYANAVGYFVDVERGDKGSEKAFEAGYKKLVCFYNLKNSELAEKVDRFLEGYAVNHGKHRYIHQALLMKAETLFSKEEYTEAAQAFQNVNRLFVDEKHEESLLYKRGFSLSKVENHAGATNTFTEYIDKFPDAKNSLTAYLLRANSYMKLDDRGRALRDYDHVIKTAEKTESAAIALQRSAQLQWVSQKEEDSVKRFETLLANHPKLSDKTKAYAEYMVGRGKFIAKDYKSGLRSFNRSRELDPDTFAAEISMYRVVGNFTMRKLIETSRAVADAEAAGIAKKIPLNVYRWLGGEYYNDENYVKSSENLRKGVELGKPEATPLPIWRILTKAQYRGKLYEDALLSVDLLLEMEEDKAKRVDALLDKAKIEVALGKTGDSKATAEKALDMNPTGRTQAELLKVLGDFYFMIGEPKEAANRYVLLVDSAEELEFHPLILDRLSSSLKKLGEAEESERYTDILKSTYPSYEREKL